MEKEKVLKPLGSAKRGIVLPHLKTSAEMKTIVMPPPKQVKIPMQQHIGAPAKPVVKKGDTVFVGTLIGEADGFVSAPVHSSVSGTVTGVLDLAGSGKCVVIESDGLMTADPTLKPFEVKTPSDIAIAADKCGLVGLGGAGFPSRVKLTLKEETKIDTLIINAAECEPYITSDYRECIESCDDIVGGVLLVKNVLKIDNVIICVESNKKKAIELLYNAVAAKLGSDTSVKLMKLPTKYPQGAEKVIIYSATGRRLAAGKLPSDIGCIVMNVTSIATLYRFTQTGMPLVSKRVTVDGSAVSEPKNVIVPIGASIEELLEFVGGIDGDVSEIIMGGPMMGVDIYNANTSVEKRNNAITVMKAPSKPVKVTACIRCGRCAEACPMQLYPANVDAALSYGNSESVSGLNVNYCMECGSCAFVCPAKRPLTQTMRLAKASLKKESGK